MLTFSLAAFSPTSDLVEVGSDGKLVYTPFAMTGQNNPVNVIPDYSYACYSIGPGVVV